MKNRLEINENAIFYFTIVIFALLNLLLVNNPDQLLLPLLIIPVFLTGIYLKFGILPLGVVLLGGLIPYVALKSLELIPVITVPYILLGIASIIISKLKKSSSYNMTIATFAVSIGLLIREYFIIYIIGNSNVNEYAEVITNSIRQQIYSYVFTNSSNMGLSQMITVQNLLRDITKERILALMPAYLIITALIISYISLRILRGYLRFSPQNTVEINRVTELKASPIFLATLLIISAVGTYLSKLNRNESLYLTGFSEGILSFLGLVVVFASFMHLVVTKFGVKNNLAKVFFTLPSLFLFSIDGMIIFTILDSVLDFRRLTEYGLIGKIANSVKIDEEGKK